MNIILCNIYRPPSSTNFYNEFPEFIEAVCAHAGDRLLLCGDFNCPGTAGSIDDELDSLLGCFNLTQHITEPTRNHNLLDLLITSSTVKTVSGVQVRESHSVSDHKLLVCTLSAAIEKQETIFHSFRKIKNIDLAIFKTALLTSTIFTRPATTADAYVDQLETVVTEALDKVAPIQTKKRFCPKTTWLSPEALIAKRNRRKLERRWNATRNENVRREYRQACRAANQLIVDARKKHFESRINKASASSKQQWSEIKNLLHPQGAKTVPRDNAGNTQFCESMSNFFHNKIQDIKSAIASRLQGMNINPLLWDKEHQGTAFDDIHQATTSEVLKLINTMPAKLSPLDFVPTSLIKSCADVFALIIVHLANMSFTEGKFPTRFKLAQIKPILKKDNLDPDSPGNYRPVSNLNTISKILEKLFMTQLKQHVLQSDNFNKYQSAYRQHHSTESALLKILNDVYHSVDNSDATCLVALDLSAAFDTLDHDTLLDRLQFSFGISGSTLDWIRTYLTDRIQYVKVADDRSNSLVCNVGVPQGSVLGPLLFSLYVAPISNVISSFGIAFHQYADDTQLYLNIAPQSLDVSLNTLDRCTRAVQEWFTQNGLCLNPAKSEVMFMGTRSRVAEANRLESVSITGSSIKPADSIKNLGVYLDTNLSFDTQVNNICKTAQFHIRALRHIRQSLSKDIACRIACAIVGAKLDYCNSILYGVASKNIDKLQRVQNTLARVVSGRRKYDHIKPVLKDLHWLPIKHRINFKLATIIYKVKQTNEPTYLADLLKTYIPVKYLRSSVSNLLELQRTHTTTASRAFSVAAPKIWNNLPDSIKNLNTVKDFKSKLKTHFFKSTFG